MEFDRIIENLISDSDMSSLNKDIIEFFKNNPNPSDEGKGGVHEWAEKNGHNKHKVEEAIYKLLSTFVEFLANGRANEKNISEDSVDPKELKLGISVEYEHTTDKETAKRIALDHLAEFDDYYTRLKIMEKEADQKKAIKQEMVSGEVVGTSGYSDSGMAPQDNIPYAQGDSRRPKLLFTKDQKTGKKKRKRLQVQRRPKIGM